MRSVTTATIIALILSLSSLRAEDAPAPEADNAAAALLAKKDHAAGSRSVGKDPAFILLPRPADRNESALELFTPQVKEMRDKALAYIGSKQASDGSWSDGTEFTANTGITALACMAFMAEGSQPRVGAFGGRIDRGMEFMLNSFQISSGVIAGAGSGNTTNRMARPPGPMYEHVMATLALLMAYGDMPWREKDCHDVLDRAIQTILRSQLKEITGGGAGWRYQVSKEGQADMSVTANVLWVLRIAKKCGYSIKPGTIDRGIKFVKECANPDGTFRYRHFGLVASPSLGGTGVIALVNQGSLDDPLIPTAIQRIEEDYRIYTIADLRERRYAIYGFFYASLAMYSQGDELWIPWYKKVVQVLAAMQDKDGAFHDEYDNTVYPTALAAMILQAPLGYFPIYER
jgi:hypothetical protein